MISTPCSTPYIIIYSPVLLAHFMLLIPRMKHIAFTILFLGGSIGFSKAHSKLSCVNILQPDSVVVQFKLPVERQIMEEIQDSFSPRIWESFGRLIHRNTVSLYKEINLGFLGYKGTAELEIRITEDTKAEIILRPHYLDKHENEDFQLMRSAESKLNQIMRRVKKHFKDSPLLDGLEEPTLERLRPTLELVVFSELMDIRHEMVDVLIVIAHASAGRMFLPERNTYWDRATPTDFETTFHIPKRLEENTASFDPPKSQKYLASDYVVPENAPENVKKFMMLNRGFKLVLNPSQWIVEGVFTDKKGIDFTVILLATPDGKLRLLSETPSVNYPQHITPVNNIFNQINPEQFPNIDMESDMRFGLPYIKFGAGDFVSFFNTLEEIGYTQKALPQNPNHTLFKQRHWYDDFSQN